MCDLVVTAPLGVQSVLDHERPPVCAAHERGGKSTASERPSDAIESLGGRARVQIAATLICGNVWSHPTIFHPPIGTRGTYTNHPQGGLRELSDPGK